MSAFSKPLTPPGLPCKERRKRSSPVPGELEGVKDLPVTERNYILVEENCGLPRQF